MSHRVRKEAQGHVGPRLIAINGVQAEVSPGKAKPLTGVWCRPDLIWGWGTA